MSLVLNNLVKRFGQVTALDGISFSVDQGQVFGFLGANGAGKTTTMRIILDILRPCCPEVFCVEPAPAVRPDGLID